MKIKSLVEFFEVLEKLPRKSGSSLYYRGHSSCEYNLEPSLFRHNRHIKQEHLMFKETIIDKPNEFSEDKSTLEKLVKMQHFGLPTRLLDLTENPLAALYFACTSNDGKVAKKKDGEVIALSISGKLMKYNDSDLVMILSNLCKLTLGEKKFDTNLKLSEFNQKENVKKLLSEIKLEKHIFHDNIKPEDISKIVPVKVMKNNARIQAQAGLFLLFGTGNQGSKLEISEIYPDWIVRTKNNERIIIDKNKKSEILKQLERVDISKKTLFPGLESTADFLKKHYH